MTPPPTESRTLEAERRQLTVMFCDLVGSTNLSGQLDPEELRDVIRAYQAAATEVMQRFEGYVAQHLGDGLLIYFGYPVAHEDDARRAARTGLGIIHAMQALNQRLVQAHGVELAVRIGIHTGLVVIGDIGAGPRQEQLALGETPNVAARIQGLAEPDTVLISEATYQLALGYFECQARGEHMLRGAAEPIAVYRVVRESGAQSRLDVETSRGLTPLVGRESEVALLLDRWRQVQDQLGQVVLLSGEAGIGKSRLVQVLKEHVADTPHTRLECRSSPYYQNTALYPITDMLQRTMGWKPEDSAEVKLHKLEQALGCYRVAREETVPLFAVLLSLPLPENRYAPLNLTPQRQRQNTLETLVAMWLEESERQPVLFIIEDVHWTDPTTLELLDLLIDQSPTAAILVLLTCRPELQPIWLHRSHLAEVSLSRLSPHHMERMVERVGNGKRLPDEIMRELIEKTDGVPLFIEEMTKSVLESGVLKEVGGHYELVDAVSSLAVPSTLQDSLMARLDRLVTAKGIAQQAAVIGRQFSYELLQAVSQVDEETLHKELSRLVAAELLYQRGLPPQASYVFKHALIQDTAYQSLLRRTRQGYHQRIARVLEQQFPETPEQQPELLAHHYTEAGLAEQAVAYWRRAGQQAVERNAHQEAITQLTKGLEILKTMPDTAERTRAELDLHTILGPALIAMKGYASPEVEQTYTRARELSQHLEDRLQLFLALRGLWNCYLMRTELQTARRLGEQLFHLASHAEALARLVEAHRVLGTTLFFQGELLAARTHLEDGITLYDRQQHQTLAVHYGADPGVTCRVYAARTLWLLGYPGQALHRGYDALHLARDLGHLFSLGFALSFLTDLLLLRREGQAAHAQNEAVLALVHDYGFPHWVAIGMINEGWSLIEQGQWEAGITQMSQGMDIWQATGAALEKPLSLAVLAEAYGKVGRIEEGLASVAAGLAIVDNTGECWWEAELHRLQGMLILQQTPPDVLQGEACFHNALDVARRQQAKSLELRAATSLAHLWQSQDKRQEAYDLLAPVYNWFTEGFDTADLQDAKGLLDELVLSLVQPHLTIRDHMDDP